MTIQPASWWKSRYDAAWTVSQYKLYKPMAVAADSWPIYNLAYALDGTVSMYLASGDPRYIDQCLEFVNDKIGVAAPSSSFSTSQFKDGYLTWVNHTHPSEGNDGKEYALYESFGWRYVARLLWTIRNSPLYDNPIYRAHYDAILAFTEQHIFDKWHARGVEANIYRSNTHMACHWAMISMYLSMLTEDSVRAARARQVQDEINFNLPNYDGASHHCLAALHCQMKRSPINLNAVFWSDVWGSTSRPGQDVAHGNGVVTYIVEAYGLGQGAWTRPAIDKLITTFDEVVWPAPTTYANFVDGSGKGNGWFPDGWWKLGRYDADLQVRLEGHKVGLGVQAFGNGALNAKVLTGT